ncbi:MAG TPA: hypothetical protein VL572_11870 [Pyrinomonadaceae bacterium]|nr:hypothetical protein [Pyrinomonadaceae bacterium]
MSKSQVNEGNTISERTVACCTPAPVGIRGSNAEVSACGCESAPPAAGEGACCGKQAAKFGIEVRAEGGCGCA